MLLMTTRPLVCARAGATTARLVTPTQPPKVRLSAPRVPLLAAGPLRRRWAQAVLRTPPRSTAVRMRSTHERRLHVTAALPELLAGGVAGGKDACLTRPKRSRE
jgi:hypothetical protein